MRPRTLNTEDFNRMVGANLKRLREAAGLTQLDIWALSKVNPSTVSRIESGERAMSLEMAHMLSSEFGVSLDEFVR